MNMPIVLEIAAMVFIMSLIVTGLFVEGIEAHSMEKDPISNRKLSKKSGGGSKVKMFKGSKNSKSTEVSNKCGQLIQGSYEYAGGCHGSVFRATVSCKAEHCEYSEYRITSIGCEEEEDVDDCVLSGKFKKSENLIFSELTSTCELKPVSLVYTSTCDFKDSAPPTHLKASFTEDGKEMYLYFSSDNLKTYYNEDDPRVAFKISKSTGKGRVLLTKSEIDAIREFHRSRLLDDNWCKYKWYC